MVDGKKVKAWLDSKVGEVKCTLCGSTDIKVAREVLAVPLDHPNPKDPNAHPVALVRLRCGHCANMMFLHARSIGIV